MKKLFLLFVATATLSLVSCNNNATEGSDVASDSTQVENATDSLATDSLPTEVAEGLENVQNEAPAAVDGAAVPATAVENEIEAKKENVKEAAKDLKDAAKDAAKQVGDAAKDAVKKAGDDAKDVAKDAINKGAEAVKDAANKAIDAAKKN